MVVGVLDGEAEVWEGTSCLGLKFGLKTVCYDAGECQRDQRRLQTHTLSVTYTRVRDKAVENVEGGSWGPGWGGRG